MVIRQAVKVSQVGAGKNTNSPLQSKTKRCENFLDQKKVKITKRMLIKVTQVLIVSKC